MKARINGEEREVPSGRTLWELVLDLGFVPEAVAVAVNGDVVRRATLAERRVAEGDVVEVIRAVGGG